MSIIDRLRDPYRDEWLHNDDRAAMLHAADELERLYAALANGPSVWECYERNMGAWWHRFVTEKPDGDRYRDVRPLYFIPAPEPKP